MEDKLERIYEYRLLAGKRDALDIPLAPLEAARLQRLSDSLPVPVPTLDDSNGATRLITALPVRITLRGHFVPGLLRNVSAGGFAIALEEPPLLAESGVVNVSEPLHGIEYCFPGHVVARVLSGELAIGWAFDGVPSQRRMGKIGSGIWRSEQGSSDEAPLDQHRRRFRAS